MVGVRPSPQGKRLGHGPRRRRRGVLDRQPSVGENGGGISWSRQTGRQRKPPQYVGLPWDVLLAAGTVVPNRSRLGHPRSSVLRTAHLGEVTVLRPARSLLLSVLC